MRKIVVVSFSFVKGGAAIAANKFVHLLSLDDSPFSYETICQSKAGYFHFFKRLISFLLSKLQFDKNPIKHSLNLFSYKPLVSRLKTSQTDIFHFHWINNDTLSVFDLDKIPSGSVFTLHDEWLFCGAEHCSRVLNEVESFKKGYKLFEADVWGIHWNYLIWKIKFNKLAGRQDIIYTVPSRWMLERAMSSLILKDAKVRYLPNPIDTSVFNRASVADITALKRQYNIFEDNIVIGFGAIGGKKNPIKGAQLLDLAFSLLKNKLSDRNVSEIVLLDFGGEVAESCKYGFRNISVGHIQNKNQLSTIYSSCDFFVVPSVVESFGQVAAESLSCETPVVCFDTSGLNDIVIHRQTGLVARSFDVESLAEQILAMINFSAAERKKLGLQGRVYIENKFSYDVVSKKYFEILFEAEQLKNKF